MSPNDPEEQKEESVLDDIDKILDEAEGETNPQEPEKEPPPEPEPTDQQPPQDQIGKRTHNAVGGGKPPTPRPRRKRGRPTKETMIPWDEAEALYITTNYSTERIAQEYHCSPSIVRENSRKNDWVKKRKRHQSRVSARAISTAERAQALDLAGEVENVGKLAHGVLGRLAQKIGTPRTKQVECPHCKKKHAVEMPHVDVTVADLVQLLKVRSHLKGDPEFVVKVEEDTDAAKDLKKLSPQELEERMKTLLVEAEGYTLE